MKNLKSPKEREHEIKRRYLCVSLAVSLCWLMAVPALGIVQIGLSLKSHDASQRANGFMTFFGGVVIAFAKEILDTILS